MTCSMSRQLYINLALSTDEIKVRYKIKISVIGKKDQIRKGKAGVGEKEFIKKGSIETIDLKKKVNINNQDQAKIS